MKKVLVAMMGWLALAIVAQASSFDCAMAQSKVEHLICATREISKLDDELAESYKAALKSESRAEVVKQAQKRWLKVRNDCIDAECVKRAYEERLRDLDITGVNDGVKKAETSVMPTQTANQGKEVEELSHTPPKLRYAFCDPNNRRLYCKDESGKGYQVCESYLAQLNSQMELPICDALIPAGFARPAWEEIDVTKHLEAVYLMEKIFLQKIGGYTHPEYEMWRQRFVQEIQEKRISPRMRKTRVAPNDKGEITVLAYTHDRDSCRKSYELLSKNRLDGQLREPADEFWNQQGDAHFVLKDDENFTVEEINGWGGSKTQTELLLFDGRPYLIQTERPFASVTKYPVAKTITPMSKSAVTIWAFDPRFPDRSRPNLTLLNSYLVEKHCQFKPDPY